MGFGTPPLLLRVSWRFSVGQDMKKTDHERNGNPLRGPTVPATPGLGYLPRMKLYPFASPPAELP